MGFLDSLGNWFKKELDIGQPSSAPAPQPSASSHPQSLPGINSQPNQNQPSFNIAPPPSPNPITVAPPRPTPQAPPVHTNFFNPFFHQLNQAANGAVSDLKDIGDLGALGVANLTNNQKAANNARNAIGNNNANLDTKNFATNLGGLSQDVGVTPAAKAYINTGAGIATGIVNGLTGQNQTSQQAIGGGPLGGITNWASDNGTVNEGTARNLAGNAINTGVNLLTLGKGKAIDQAAEGLIGKYIPQLAESGLGRAAQRLGGSEVVAGLYGAGLGASQAAQSANNIKEAGTDIGKGIVQNLPFGFLGVLPNAAHGVINTANKVADSTPAIINQTRQLVADQGGHIGFNNVADNHPAVAQLNDHLDTLNKLRDNMTQNGLDERNPAMVNNAKAYQATLDELNNTRNAITQGGYAKVPGTPEPTPEAPQVGKTIKGLDGKPLEVDGNDVILTHRTTPENAKAIRQTGKLDPSKAGTGNDKAVTQDGRVSYLTTNESQNFYGDEVVKVRMPVKQFEEQLQKNKVIIAKLEKEIADGKVPDMYIADTKAQIENIKNNPEILSDVPLSVAQVGKTSQVEPPVTKPEHSIIVSETKPMPDGSKIVIKAGRDPNTGMTIKWEERVDKNTDKAINISKSKTGVVDAKLQDLEKQRKQVINDVGAEIKEQNPKSTLYSDILKTGISPKERGSYPHLPLFLLRKGGRGLDELSINLPSEIDNEHYHMFRNDPEKLYNAIMDVKKPLKAYEIKELAEEQLASGSHPGSEYFNRIEQAIANRQSELSQYPNGKYRQVKITNSPNKMSNEELTSLTNTPEGQARNTSGNVVNRNDKLALRNLQAETQVLADIKEGKTSDEVLYNYMKATGTDLQTASRDVTRTLNEAGINSTFGNKLRGSVSLPEATDAGQAHLNAEMVSGQLDHAKDLARDSVKNLSDHDINLMKDIETKPVEVVAKDAENPEQFLSTVDSLRHYYDLRDAWDQYLGIQHGYRVNYLRQLIDKAEEGPTEPSKAGGGNTRLGYTKARTKETLGTNVMDALDRESGATHNLGKLAYEKGLNEVYGDRVNKGEVLRNDEGTYETLRTKYGKGLTASPEVAKEINHRAVPNETGPILSKYDKFNALIKYIKLGGGLFHATTEAMNYLGHQVANKETYTHPVKAAHDLARVTSATFSKAKSQEGFKYFDTVNAGEKYSTMDKARVSDLKVTPQEILGDVNVSAVDKWKDNNPIKAIHDMVFGREIPMMKLTIFEQKTKGLDIHNPEDLLKIRQAANALNHLFGGLGRATDTHVLSPTNAKVAGRFLLATDFTEAKINTIRDALTNKSVQGSIARQAVLGKTLVAAMPGLIAYTALGQINWNDPKDVAKKIGDQVLDPHFPTPFKTNSGIIKIGKTPETFISEFGRLITPLFADGPDKKGNELTALQHYATGRLAALPSTGLQITSNKDYFGNPVIEKNNDGSIKIGQSARNIGLQVAPIPIVQANTVYKTQRETPGNTTSLVNSLAEAGSNIAGFRTKADPNDPKMKSLNFQNQVVGGLSDQDKAAWNVVHGKVYDQYGNVKSTVTPADLLNKYTTELSNPTILATDKQINDYKKSQGQPSDPFYDLSPEQQRTLLIIKTLKNVDRGDNSGTAKIMTERNQGWIDQYYKDSSSYYNELNLPPSTKTRLIENPSVSPEVQKALDESKGLAGQDYHDYVVQHPELTDYYSKLDSVIRQQRDYYNEPQFKGYPSASDRVSQLLDASRNMPKSTQRTAIFKDPEVSNFLADVAMWQLNQGASKARFEGQDYTQKDLKNIYSVGNYDISKLANGLYAQTAGTLSDGTKLAGNGYTTGGSSGFSLGTAGSSSSGGGSTKHKKIYMKNKRIKIRKAHIRPPHIRPVYAQNKTYKGPLKISRPNKVNEQQLA